MDVVDAETEEITGSGPGAEFTKKYTMFDTSVVFAEFGVLFMLAVPETAEPGIWTETCTCPGVVMSEAGTTAVIVVLLTKTVSANCAPFHRMNAPVTKPAPLTVRLKSEPPAVTVAGDTNDTDEEDV
jgi:hypothetical protein